MGLFRRKPHASGDPAVTGPTVTSLSTEIDRLREQLTTLVQRVHAAELEREGVLAVRMDLGRLADRVAEFDARITAVSTELANQIDELGHEIAGIDRSTNSAATSAMDELRNAQTRLASEQARYQIAFRQDLAELADRLRPR